ncbi:glycosyltransferase family 4 protein [Inhella sp.]|uniref:glycosyltransferase family 4 protein n=1 Tax=Inhella sp. TaxID=1921806 RepID=UPI0035AE18F9
MSAPVRSLLFSTLYPSSARPGHGLFVETRLRELLGSGCVEAQVVAPVPWFPSTHPRFGDWARMAATPRREERHGIRIEHPRYLLPPKIGQNVHPYVLALGALPTIRRLQRVGFDFDLIDAHFFYPDGVAASLLSRWLGKPFVCTARGSDINLYRQFPWPRRLIQQTLQRSQGNIGVSADLVRSLIELGAPPERCHVMRNGVDLERFQPLDRQASRRALGLREDGLLLLSVGHLVELKGHHLVIEMLVHRAEARLVIVGSGAERGALEALARRLNVAERVHFAGQQPSEALKTWFSAADALVLASSREGWANVLLESMACGTPVVATAVNGTPEVVASADAGQLAAQRDVPHLLDALQRLLAAYPERTAVRRYAEGFSWQATTEAQCRLFESIVDR